MKSGLDNNLDNGDLDKIEALIIDIPSPPSAAFNNKNFKAFFTLFGLVEKKEEMATALINRLFNYSLFTIGKVSPNDTYNIIDSDRFAYIVTD